MVILVESLVASEAAVSASDHELQRDRERSSTDRRMVHSSASVEVDRLDVKTRLD